ncbi:MAG TPA: SRPBCC family protein [Candidatus Deferrimicrobiaceae bacterium]|nr:SRPBCC family protein [Candidatus Deferrimicrobiaceae bacterium]
MTNSTGALTLTTPSDREIVLTRVFDAPRIRVFDALTRPDLLTRWHGPHGWSLVVCEVDPKPRGAYRFVWRRSANGAAMGMRGVYREVVPPERLVHTERFDRPWYPGEAVITTVLAEQDGRTTLTATLRYESRAARDLVLGTAMEDGVAEGYDKLAELLG